MENKNQGLIFNIQRFVLHDGPGIRTTVFFKGCNLRCKWCHNPEGIKSFPELIYRDTRCSSCGKCIEMCPLKALKLNDNGILLDRNLCSNCFECLYVCNSNALEKCGEYITAEKILEEVLSDQEFYKQSSGGLTISGGEPLLQFEFLLELLKKAKNADLHICLDTTGNIEEEKFKEIIKYVDILLYDIKTLDNEKHKILTGISNNLILKNLYMCLNEKKNIIVRIPIIPGYNFIHMENEISNHIQFLVEKGINKFELIPYHKFGEQKYRMLGKEYNIELEKLNEDILIGVVNKLEQTLKISIHISKPIIT